ncbi:MAG: hypothetical protein ABR549_05370 [Mycobacteriales bacterium]
MKLVVLLQAVPGRAAALASYEDKVLAILEARYGGKVLQRLTVMGEGPTEVQVLELPGEAALTEFMADPERLALADERDGCVARTELFRAH